jgi:hypothetical protein
VVIADAEESRVTALTAGRGAIDLLLQHWT